MRHWTEQYLNKRWAPHASGPNWYDCYSFYQAIVRDRAGVLIPDQDKNQKSCAEAVNVAVSQGKQNPDWRELAGFEPLAFVCMGRMINGEPVFGHVGCGVIIDKTEYVIHVAQGQRSALHRLADIPIVTSNKLLEFYKYGHNY